jgi:orotate phosphoribosyltransferase
MSDVLRIDVEEVINLASLYYREQPDVTVWKVLQAVKAVYERPENGFWVQYVAQDKMWQHYIGEVYVNMAMVERVPIVLRYFADRLMYVLARREILGHTDVFVGAPQGGIAFAQALAVLCEKQLAYPEKKVVGLASYTKAKVWGFVWGRHQVFSGQKVVLVEDVCHNLSTVKEMIELVENRGAEVIAIVCILNRSELYRDEYVTENGVRIPIFSLQNRVFAKHNRTEEGVDDSMIISKPKDEWAKLIECMEESGKGKG